MRYKQITKPERVLIHYHLRRGCCPAQIGRMLNRHRSTISRELGRNMHDGRVYIPQIAQEHANGRRSRSRKKVQYSKHEWSTVGTLIREDWSPEQASSVLRLMNIMPISHQTIYKYIWREKRAGGKLWKHLRQSCKRRRKRYRAGDSRGVLRGKRDIEERPMGAQNRSRKGHFEVDLVHGAGSRVCMVTLVDRKTRYVLIRKAKDKTMREVNRVLVPMIRKLKMKTITADNGSEFHDYKRVEKLTGASFYFAKPYHSWERGTSENTNGLIRQYFPKNQSLSGLTQTECNAVARKLNRRPRKILNLQTPEEAHYGKPLLLHF